MNSVGSTLSQLTDGFDGTLFIASGDTTGATDGFLLAASGLSVDSIYLASKSSDPFISDAAQQIYGEYDHTFSATDGSLIEGHNIVMASASTTFSTLVSRTFSPSFSSSAFLGMIELRCSLFLSAVL